MNFRFALVLMILFAASGVARAELVKLTVTGTIDAATHGGDFDAGDPFTVVFTIDTDTPVNPSPTPTATTAYYSNAIKSMTVTSGSYDSTYANPAGIGRIQIVDNDGANEDYIRLLVFGDGSSFNYNIQSRWKPGTTTPLPNAGYLDDLFVEDLDPGPEQFKELRVSFRTSDTSFITDRELPTTFNGFTFDLLQDFAIMSRSNSSGINDTALSASSQIVPEPSTLGLLAVAGLTLLRRRRRCGA